VRGGKTERRPSDGAERKKGCYYKIVESGRKHFHHGKEEQAKEIGVAHDGGEEGGKNIASILWIKKGHVDFNGLKRSLRVFGGKGENDGLTKKKGGAAAIEEKGKRFPRIGWTEGSGESRHSDKKKRRVNTHGKSRPRREKGINQERGNRLAERMGSKCEKGG